MHRNWLLITFLVVVVVGLYMIWENAPIATQSFEDETAAELFPQNYVTGVKVAQFREDGSLDFHFVSERLDYFQRDPDSTHPDDYAIVTNPAITFFHAEQKSPQSNDNTGLEAASPEWYLTAETGKATENFKIIELEGEVDLWQPASSKNHIAVETSHLILDTEIQIAHSAEAVIMRYINATHRGVGFEAKLKEELLTLSDGTTVYEPLR